MRTDTPKTIYLKDYTHSPYQIDHIDLNFDIHDGHTIVESRIQFTMTAGNAEPLFLHGEDLELLEITLNETPVTHYETDHAGLTLPCPDMEAFTLFIKTKIVPEKNTRLEGLYRSGDTYCTQCEAEGFRRITYYLDRPDIMTTFTVRVEADEKFPVLLSNGNRVDGDQLENGRHFTIWEDPWPKPCYLFALVAGDLTHIHDTFTTKSGREVDLYIFVRPGDESQCDHAMESLKKSMTWDEEVYGLEYDLDLFNIVAVSDFNMGAMENKSLNIFNTALVLAHQDTATDTDFMRVESVIAHEYFHNWSGINRSDPVRLHE